jgi:hypothetical protein
MPVLDSRTSVRHLSSSPPVSQLLAFSVSVQIPVPSPCPDPLSGCLFSTPVPRSDICPRLPAPSILSFRPNTCSQPLPRRVLNFCVSDSRWPSTTLFWLPFRPLSPAPVSQPLLFSALRPNACSQLLSGYMFSTPLSQPDALYLSSCPDTCSQPLSLAPTPSLDSSFGSPIFTLSSCLSSYHYRAYRHCPNRVPVGLARLPSSPSSLPSS